MNKGIILKVVGGLFYVLQDNNIITCKASGKLRDFKDIPLAGDTVFFESTPNGEGYIKKIEERKNFLIRPPVANIDQAIVVTSLVEPDFSSFLLDKLLTQIIDNNITPIIYFSKKDKVKNIGVYEKYFEHYRNIGIDVYIGNSLDKENNESLKRLFANKVSIVTGQSGAGKSTFLNSLSDFNLKTGDYSHALGRGKHTTREVEFFQILDGLVADTPGFSSMNLMIDAQRLAHVFPGFEDGLNCKYRGCLHESEPGCCIKEKITNKEYLEENYNNYLKLLENIKHRKEY